MSFRDLVNWEHPVDMPVLRGDRFGRSLLSLRDDMDRLFQDVVGEALPAFHKGTAFLAIDVIETDERFKVRAELFGMEPGDVEVTVSDNNCLTIQGEKKEERSEEDKRGNYLRREISHGSFCRTVALPQSADVDAAQASFANGVLTVEVPKKAEALQRTKKLPIRKDEDVSQARH